MPEAIAYGIFMCLVLARVISISFHLSDDYMHVLNWWERIRVYSHGSATIYLHTHLFSIAELNTNLSDTFGKIIKSKLSESRKLFSGAVQSHGCRSIVTAFRDGERGKLFPSLNIRWGSTRFSRKSKRTKIDYETFFCVCCVCRSFFIYGLCRRRQLTQWRQPNKNNNVYNPYHLRARLSVVTTTAATITKVII